MDQTTQRATKSMTLHLKPSSLATALGVPAMAVVVVAALGLGTPASAQQQTPQPQQPQQPQVQLVEKAKHGDWRITCPTAANQQTQQNEDTADPSGKGDLDTGNNTENATDTTQTPGANCFMMQAARHTEKQELAVSVMVFKNTVEGKTVSQLRVNVPAQFYVLLPAGIGMEIDGDAGSAEQLQYMFCPPPGLCIAIKELTDELLAKLKKGTTTKLYIWDVRRRGAVFELSLKGFTKAYEEM